MASAAPTVMRLMATAAMMADILIMDPFHGARPKTARRRLVRRIHTPWEKHPKLRNVATKLARAIRRIALVRSAQTTVPQRTSDHVRQGLEEGEASNAANGTLRFPNRNVHPTG